MKRRAAPWRGPVEAYLSQFSRLGHVKALNLGTLTGKLDLRGEKPGTWSLRCRVGGVLEQMWIGETMTGNLTRSTGAFVARLAYPSDPSAFFADSMVVPDVLADRLYPAWSAERAQLPARFPARLVFDYRVWAIATPGAPRGAQLRVDGKHWSADPFLASLKPILHDDIPMHLPEEGI